jgi:hypothetical protein
MTTGKSRILVCGGRTFYDVKMFEHTMQEARQKWFATDFCIIQGGALGADGMAKQWAKFRGICCITVDADWDFYKNTAGILRNGWMLDYCKPELVIAFPGGTGTANMCRQAAACSVSVFRALA